MPLTALTFSSCSQMFRPAMTCSKQCILSKATKHFEGFTVSLASLSRFNTTSNVEICSSYFSVNTHIHVSSMKLSTLSKLSKTCALSYRSTRLHLQDQNALSMFTSDCRWQRRLTVRYNVEFLEQNGCTHLKLAERVRIFIFVDVNTKQENMPPSTRSLKIILF